MFKTLTGSRLATSATLLGGFTAANQGLEFYKNAKSRYEDKFCYTATLKSEGYVYRYFLEWLEEETAARGLTWISRRDGLTRQFDSSGQNVMFEGHKVRVSIDKEDVSSKSAFSDDTKETAFFVSRSAEGIAAVERLLTRLTEDKSVVDRRTWLYTPERYGWNSSTLPKRDIDSVFLAPGVKESLLEDLQNFFDSEDHYKRIGTPWHRGYLLYGEPGNGKSSIASAIANKFRLNLYSLPLNSVDSDTSLTEFVNNMEERSVLLIEDIDIFKSTTTRDTGEKGPTLAGLLNALDGVGTPHGMLTFITTNHVNSLDPALIRAGRTDYRVELKSPVDEQIADLFFYAYGEPLNAKPRSFKNMAEVTNVLKTNISSAADARKELTETAGKWLT